MSESDIAAARELVANVDRIVILTGAGVSAESGVPTFRGEGGLWKSYRPEELATPQAFAADPRLVWEWYDMRRSAIALCEPNAGHEAIARACVEHASCHLVTQNVDGLHHLALGRRAPSASPDQYPITLHGSLYRIRCSCCAFARDDRDPVDSTSVQTLPRCPECDALLRPGVVWFGEALDPDVLAHAFEVAAAADVCIVAGTSALVHPAASIPLATLDSGGIVIEVNPDETPLSRHARYSLRGASGEILPIILP